MHIHSDGQRKHLLASVLVGVVAFIILLLGLLLVYRGHKLVEQQLRDRLRDTAAVGALEINADILQNIHGPADAQSASLITTVQQLHQLQDSMTNASSVYLMRKTKDPNTLTFIADASMLETKDQLDENHNGKIDENEAPPIIGEKYDVRKFPVLRNEAFLHPAVDAAFTTDQWGTVISGYAPVRSSDGKTVAILGIDMDAKEFLAQTRDLGSEFLTFLVLLGGAYVVWVSILMILQWRMDILRRLEEERTSVLLLASHQLGEPLTIFKLSAEALADERKSPNLEGVVDENLHNIQQGIARMEAVLSLLNTASMLEEGDAGVKREEASVGEIIRSVLHDYKTMLDEKKQTVEMRLEDDLALRTDPRFLRKILRELLDNASAYSPVGSSITISAAKQGEEIVLEIIDHGCGIPQEDTSRLFGKFVRGSNALAQRPNGYGLGLFVAQHLARLLGGKITLQSRLSEGTKATVLIPVREKRKWTFYFSALFPIFRS